MKKLLNTKTYLLWGAAVLAIVAFVLSFVATVVFTYKGSIVNMESSTVFKNVIWGSNEQFTSGTNPLFSHEGTTNSEYAALTLPLIGYILIAVGGFIALSLPCLNLSVFKKNAMLQKVVSLVAALLLVVGGVFVLTTLNQFYKVYEIAEESYEYYKANAAVTISAILAFLAALACIISNLVKVKKARKK